MNPQKIRQDAAGIFKKSTEQSPGIPLPLDQAMVRESFGGEVTFRGYGELCLRGYYGEEYAPIVSWTQSVPLPENSTFEVWPEISWEKNAEVCLRLFFRDSGSREVTGTKAVENPDAPVTVETGDGMRLGVTLEARGSGLLRIGTVHVRQKVAGGDAFCRGTKREMTESGEELFTCFSSMDRRPPLTVLFSARRPQEGFDGLEYLQKMGTPYLAVMDPRLCGGCGYLGSEDYERRLEKRIRSVLATLGFDNSQLILMGDSMGAAGALYYGARLHPRAMLLGRPLWSLGRMALLEKLWRPGGFPVSLDLLQKLSGGVGEDDAGKLDERLWSRVDQGSFEGTEMAVAYMREDDCDPSAYMDLLHHLRGKKARVYAKGFEGRHADSAEEVSEWLELCHRRILKEKFARK